MESMHYEIVSERGNAVIPLIISRFTKKQIDFKTISVLMIKRKKKEIDFCLYYCPNSD